MHLIENRSSKNEMWCAADNHNYMCHICKKKNFIDLNSKQTVIDKISNFHKIATNFTNSKKIEFNNNNDNYNKWKKIGQLLLPYKLFGRDM